MQAGRNLLLLISLLVPLHCNLGIREPLAIKLAYRGAIIQFTCLS